MSQQSFLLLNHFVLTNKRHLWKTRPPLVRCLQTEDLQEHRRCRSLAMVACQMCSWVNFFPERTAAFSASYVAATGPKAVMAIAGTDNMTWHHNFIFQSKLLYHQQRGQHSHLADIRVFHFTFPLRPSFRLSTPASWLCSCLYHCQGAGLKKTCTEKLTEVHQHS